MTDLRTIAASTLRHPDRTQILDALSALGDMSPTTFRKTMDNPRSIQGISYHFRILETNGLVRVKERRPVRGAMEHIYTITPQGRKVASALAGLR